MRTAEALASTYYRCPGARPRPRAAFRRVDIANSCAEVPCATPVCALMTPLTWRHTSGAIHRKTALSEVSVDDDVLVYDRSTASCHLLNASAGSIWQMIDGTRTAVEIAAALEQRYPEMAGTLGSEVDRALADLEAAGLTTDQVDDEAGGVRATPNPRPAATVTEQPSAVAFQALDYSFGLHGPMDVVESLAASLRTLATDRTAASVYTITERTIDGLRQLDVSNDGAIVGTAGDRTVADVVFQDLNQRASAASGTSLLVHASAVLTTDGVVLFAGTANAGKSTLVTGLVRAGFPYVTDEAVAIDLESLEAIAYPKPIGIDTGSYELFPDLERTANDRAAQRWWINPLDAAEHSTCVENGSTHRLSGVVFLRFTAGATLAEEALAPPHAALALAGNLFNLPEHPQRGLETAARVAAKVPCRRVEHGDLDEMVAWVSARYQPAVLPPARR